MAIFFPISVSLSAEEHLVDSHQEEEEEEDSQREVRVDSEVDEEGVKKRAGENLSHCLVRLWIQDYQLLRGRSFLQLYLFVLLSFLSFLSSLA